MPNAEQHREPDIDEVSAELDASLKSCRAVLANYRTMLEDGDRAGDDVELVDTVADAEAPPQDAEAADAGE